MEVHSSCFGFFISFDQCVKKSRDVGRLGLNPNPKDVVSKSREVRLESKSKRGLLKSQGDREVRLIRFVWFISSNLYQCVKNPGR